MANETSLLLWWTSLVTLWIFNPTTSRQTSNNMPCCWSLRLVVLSHVWLWVGQPIRLLRTCEVSVQSGWGFTLYSGNTHWQTHTRSAAHSFRPTLNSSEFRSVGLLGLFWCDWVSHCKLALGQKFREKFSCTLVLTPICGRLLTPQCTDDPLALFACSCGGFDWFSTPKQSALIKGKSAIKSSQQWWRLTNNTLTVQHPLCVKNGGNSTRVWGIFMALNLLICSSFRSLWWMISPLTQLETILHFSSWF